MKAEKDASLNFLNEKNVEGINKRKQDSYLSVIFNQKTHNYTYVFRQMLTTRFTNGKIKRERISRFCVTNHVETIVYIMMEDLRIC